MTDVNRFMGAEIMWKNINTDHRNIFYAYRFFRESCTKVEVIVAVSCVSTVPFIVGAIEP